MDDLHGKNDNLARENKTLSDRLRECEGNLKDATRSALYYRSLFSLGSTNAASFIGSNSFCSALILIYNAL